MSNDSQFQINGLNLINYREKPGYTDALLGYLIGLEEYDVRTHLKIRGFKHSSLIAERVQKDIEDNKIHSKREMILNNYESILPPEETLPFIRRWLSTPSWHNDELFRLSLFFLHQLVVTKIWINTKHKDKYIQIRWYDDSSLMTSMFKFLFSTPSGDAPENLKEDYLDNEFDPLAALENKGLIFRYSYSTNAHNNYHIVIPPHLTPIFTDLIFFKSIFPKYEHFFGSTKI